MRDDKPRVSEIVGGTARVIDYFHQDFTNNSETYDVVFDAIGKLSFEYCRGSVSAAVLPGYRRVRQHPPGHLDGLVRRQKGAHLVSIDRGFRQSDVLLIRDIVEAGKYRAVIDRRYAIEDVVEAVKYVETQQKTGNVVLDLSR